MPGYRCALHGNKFALIFCEHAHQAVEARRDEPVFLRKDRWGWATLCEACVRAPDPVKAMDAANSLICVACVQEGVAQTGNRYDQRTRRARPELPPDLQAVADAAAARTRRRARARKTDQTDQGSG